jgi:hypothetical protein
MTSLVSRIEAAIESDRELDIEIALSIGWHRYTDEEGRVYWEAPQRVVVPDLLWRSYRTGNFDLKRTRLPQFTASLDAAMILIPNGWYTFYASEDRHSHSWRWELRKRTCDQVNARATSAARALTAASLRCIFER